MVCYGNAFDSAAGEAKPVQGEGAGAGAGAGTEPGAGAGAGAGAAAAVDGRAGPPNVRLAGGRFGFPRARNCNMSVLREESAEASAGAKLNLVRPPCNEAREGRRVCWASWVCVDLASRRAASIWATSGFSSTVMFDNPISCAPRSNACLRLISPSSTVNCPEMARSPYLVMVLRLAACLALSFARDCGNARM